MSLFGIPHEVVDISEFSTVGNFGDAITLSSPGLRLALLFELLVTCRTVEAVSGRSSDPETLSDLIPRCTGSFRLKDKLFDVCNHDVASADHPTECNEGIRQIVRSGCGRHRLDHMRRYPDRRDPSEIGVSAGRGVSSPTQTTTARAARIDDSATTQSGVCLAADLLGT
jgi:hypothetical protein